VTRALPRLEPLRYARTGTLEVAYYEAGPSDGDVTLLLHGFPYNIHSYTEVIPLADGNFPATDGTLSAPHFTGPACITGCRALGTTCPRKLRVPSPARSWNWQAQAMTAGAAHPTKGTRQ